MPDSLQSAVDLARSFMRQGYDGSYAIGMASKRTGLGKKEIASAMSSRRWDKREIGDIKKTLSAAKNKENLYRSATEKCRDCGADLSYKQEQCNLCGADTQWIWEIAERIDEI